MAAIVVDMKDMGLRTPEQALRVFYLTYGPESVRSGLLAVLCGFVTARKLDGGGELPEIKEVAQLFDGLISLVNAVAELQGGTDGRRVICGRTGDGGLGDDGGSGDDVCLGDDGGGGDGSGGPDNAE